MGLCVHPVLPWSEAGQAGIWGQAKNSFPWREPPTPSQAAWPGQGWASTTQSSSESKEGDRSLP